MPPHVVYAHLKYLWAIGSREETLRYLYDFTEDLTRDLRRDSGSSTGREVAKVKLDRFSRLLARCHFKQGEWQSALHEDWGEVSRFRSLATTTTDARCRDRYKKYCSPTVLPPTTIRNGTKLGIRGLSPTSRSSATWRATPIVEAGYPTTNLLSILFKPSMASSIPLPYEM